MTVAGTTATGSPYKKVRGEREKEHPLEVKMKNVSKGSKLSSKHGAPEVKKDRKSGSGVNGSPKKGGQGGKFTWAGDGYSGAELGWTDKEPIDANDPNFEEPDLVTP